MRREEGERTLDVPSVPAATRRVGNDGDARRDDASVTGFDREQMQQSTGRLHGVGTVWVEEAAPLEHRRETRPQEGMSHSQCGSGASER